MTETPTRSAVNPGPIEAARDNRTLYIVLGVLLVVALVLAGASYRSHKVTAQSRAKAQQVQAGLVAAGLPKFASVDQIARVFGTDGGAVCKNPSSALNEATHNSTLTNGSGGPGARPTIADDQIFQGEAIVLGIYCPQQLPAFVRDHRDFQLKDVAGN
jgi:hypothetical protein